MSKKKTAKINNANVYVSLYEGTFDMGFDCIGAAKCAHARFYTDPPEPDDDCSCFHNGTCTNGPARKAALELLRERIAAELEKFEE